MCEGEGVGEGMSVGTRLDESRVTGQNVAGIVHSEGEGESLDEGM